MTLDSKLSFNEASFGFVPHGGSSFYLSRLPGEIGTFLALTGFPLTGIDAKEIGIADSLVHYSQAYEEEIADILFAMEFPVPNYDLISNKGTYRPWREQIGKRLKEDGHNIIHEEFMEPKDKVPSMTADADFHYKKMMENYN